ncbi:MAG: N-acetylmuramoyl-L-alanine amidase [Terriglobales bacterium]
MSANSTQIDWEMPAAADTLREGNRVLESIARQEALGALLAFSDLHQQIESRRIHTGCAAEQDLFETERFIRDEVLQLICDRAQSVTGADGIVIALAEESPETTEPETTEMVCRASAGPLAVERGTHLNGESEFLQDCLDSGTILRCDACEIDARVELDLAHTIGARSTVLVPLRGRFAQLGVLQAFSRTPRAFADHDVRCLDLFAELVLSALKPEDQDRRFRWLAEVADEVLGTKSAALGAGTAPAETVNIDHGKSVETEFVPSAPAVLPVPDLTVLEQTVAVPAAMSHSPQLSFADNTIDDESLETVATAPVDLSPIESPSVQPWPVQPSSGLSFLHRLSLAGSSHPGLSVVMGLVAVAALFSAGAWWGMQSHGKTALAKVTIANPAASPQLATPPSIPTVPVLPSASSDNPMNPSQLASGTAPLTAVAEDKLAALPKITGVRHWSSSMGSTVVIDMEDQVPYEVHRLMSPERIYFDLHDTVLAPELDGKTLEIGDTSLTRVRVAQPVAGVTRVVLDTINGSNFSVSMESSPYRLVVELRGSEKTLDAKQFSSDRMSPNPITPSLAAAPAPPKAAPIAALAVKATNQPVPVKTGKFRIVLDAGHGGWDLGTVGRQGLLEKDLVLDVAQRLGKLLQARLGSEVMFTRTGDTYLPLDQRSDLANQAQADLFVSVHANYSSSAAARGVETYYSNLFSAPGSREVERHDDGSVAKMTPVSLSAAGLHEKVEESRRLAASVQRSLYATLAATSPDIRDRGIKDSAFVVLTGTTMPAILTEISFVSSPKDEHNLQSATYRQQIAEALYQGIARYQSASPHAKVAQLQTAAARR